MISELQLPVDGTLDVAHTLEVLAVHSLPNQEILDTANASVDRVLWIASRPRYTRIHLEGDRVRVRSEATAAQRTELSRILNHWLGLQQPGAASLQRLASDPLLGATARRFPHLRLISYPDLFEALATTVLGQQISTAAARTLAIRYVEALGICHPSGLKVFPRPEDTAAATPQHLAALIGCPLSRAATLHRVACWYLQRPAEPSPDPAQLRGELLPLKGIGPRTADYAALRGLRDPGAFLASDLVVRRALAQLGWNGKASQLDWGSDNSLATVLLWKFATAGPAGG